MLRGECHANPPHPTLYDSLMFDLQSKFKSQPAAAKPTKKMSLGCMVVFLIPFFAVGIGTFGFGLWQVHQGVDSLSWTAADGRIKSSEVESGRDSDGLTTYHAKITYTYEWANEKKTGDQVRTSGTINTSGGGAAREEVAKYPVGKSVKVFVNPKHPDQAVLEQGLGWGHWFMPLFGLLFFGVASLFLWLTLRQARQEKERQAQLAAGPLAGAIDFGAADQGPAGLDWNPLPAGGGNVKTQELREGKNGIIYVALVMWIRILLAVFGCVGLIALAVGMGMFFSTTISDPWPKWVALGIGAFFSIFGLAAVFGVSRNNPRFDVQEQTGCGWRVGPWGGMHKTAFHFSQLAGVQVLSQRHAGDSDSSPYTSYQLNLVLKDLTRLNIMNHGDSKAIEADADTLAPLLRVPVWKRA